MNSMGKKKKTRAKPKPKEIVRVEASPTRLKDLPKLTDKQRAYVEAITQGLTKTTAYQSAYDTGDMDISTIWREASVLSRHPKVAAWLNWLALEAADEAKCTYDSHLISLKTIRDRALDAAEYSAAVSAEKVRGHAAGLHDKSMTVKSLDLNKLYEQIAASKRAVTIDMTADVVDTD